jgi:hypothetical protein
MLGFCKACQGVLFLLSFRRIARLLMAVASIVVLVLLGSQAAATGTAQANRAALVNYHAAVAADQKDWVGPFRATVSHVMGRDQEPGYVSATYDWKGKDGAGWELSDMWAPDHKIGGKPVIHNGARVWFWRYVGDGYSDPSYGGIFVTPLNSHATPIRLYTDLSPTPSSYDVQYAQVASWFAGWRNPGIALAILFFNILIWVLTRKPRPKNT